MTNQSLNIFLNNLLIGELTHYQDGKNIFSFSPNYQSIAEPLRPVLSLSFNNLETAQVTRHRLPTFFANLLPEGDMRQFIATQIGTHPQDDFALLAALGHDLPGAVTAVAQQPITQKTKLTNNKQAEEAREIRFSLSGVQMKFSMLKNKSWFTLAQHNELGDYIIKTPSSIYQNVPENEYTMMQLAKTVGLAIPSTSLISLDQLKNLPQINLPHEPYAYAIKRFDREENKRIHIEDFAQVFTKKPHEKYSGTNYDTMAKFIYQALDHGKQELAKFIQQLIFNILIGNTDAHLKNWSLIYNTPNLPTLSPAYDLVSTLPYIKQYNLALNLAKLKSFYQIDLEHLKYFAKRADIPVQLTLRTAQETVEKFRIAWKNEASNLPINNTLKSALAAHWQQLKIMSS